MVAITFSIAFDGLEIENCKSAFIVDPENIVWPLATCAYKCIVPNQQRTASEYESEVIHVQGDRKTLLRETEYDVAIISSESVASFIGDIKSKHIIVLGAGHKTCKNWLRKSRKKISNVDIFVYKQLAIDDATVNQKPRSKRQLVQQRRLIQQQQLAQKRLCV
jgi:hypothetical protein